MDAKKLIESNTALYEDIDRCIDNIIKSRNNPKLEQAAEMESLMTATLQQLQCNNDYLKTDDMYQEDCIWMSYRYCIGRYTIAAYAHAENIAKNAYGKLSKARMQFMSEDICREIYDRLHFKDFIDFGWYGNIPKNVFKPIDVIYSIFAKEKLTDVRHIKTISIEWNPDKEDFDYSIYYFNEDDKNKDYGRSLLDIECLEVWQKLANLFDIDSHKKEIINGEEVEYYEYWTKYRDIEGNVHYKKIKCYDF